MASTDPEGHLDGPAILQSGLTDGDLQHRARQVFEVASSWVLSTNMRLLLEAAPVIDAAAARGWLHRAEQFPSWFSSFAEGELPTPDLPAEVADVIRRVVDVEKQAAVRFDFRGNTASSYRERWEASSGAFAPGSASRILELTEGLALVRPAHPRYGRYSRTLILGGGQRSPLLRARYAALLERRGVDLGELFLLGSPRRLAPGSNGTAGERAVTDEYAPGAADEFDLMIAAAAVEFDATHAAVEFLCGCQSDADICPRWPFAADTRYATIDPRFTHERVVRLRGRDGRPRGAAVSPSTSQPPNRPNTADTFALLARYAGLAAGERVLVVTTQVFVPFQTFDALRRLYLEHGVDVDVVGYSAAWGDRPETPEYVLQETLSGVRSARRLLVAAVDRLFPRITLQHEPADR